MENQVEKLKQELVLEIKELANEISKSNSFVGLLSQEIKFKTLHEKFINLKFLERKHIGLNIFDQPIPMENEEGLFSDDETSDKVKTVHFQNEDVKLSKDSNDGFEENVIQYSEDKIEEINKNQKDAIIHDTPNEIPQEENPIVENEVKVDLFEKEISKHSIDNVEEFLPKQSNLPKIQIDFNDRMAFLHQLFDGDAEGLELVISRLNHIENLSDSNAYISDLVKEMAWENKDEYVERLQELILKRFD